MIVMPTAAELGDVMLKGLASFFNFLKELFIYITYTEHNESISGRSDWQSFWQIWYNVSNSIMWGRKMLFEQYGFIWQLNHNTTLRNELAEVVNLANNFNLFGNASGTSGLTFLLRSMSERVSSNPDFVYHIWYAVKYFVLMFSDALRMVPFYFPP